MKSVYVVLMNVKFLCEHDHRPIILHLQIVHPKIHKGIGGPGSEQLGCYSIYKEYFRVPGDAVSCREDPFGGHETAATEPLNVEGQADDPGELVGLGDFAAHNPVNWKGSATEVCKEIVLVQFLLKNY